MQTLISLRWVFVIAAAVCALVMAARLLFPMCFEWSALTDGAYYAVAPLLALGVFAMSRSGAGGWPVATGYGAVVCWVIALLGSAAGVAAGPGGLVYGIIIVLPALALAALLQLAATIGFATRRAAK